MESVGPAAGEPAYADRPAAVHGGPDDREDRPLQRRGGEDLAPAAVLVGGAGRVAVAGRHLPDLPEDDPGDGAGGQTHQHPDRLVDNPADALAHLRLPRTTSSTTAVATAPAATAAHGTGLRPTAPPFS